MENKKVAIFGIGEAFLKGENRRKFINILKKELMERNINAKFISNMGIAEGDLSSLNSLEHCFGINTIFFGEKFRDFDELVEAIKKKKFQDPIKVETKRTFKIGEKSPEVNAKIGSILKENGHRISLSNPKTTIHIRVFRDFYFLSTTKKRGPGGLPYGSTGEVCAFLSGGFDSPVAAYLLMKRGAKLRFFTFYSGEGIKKKVEEIAKKLSLFGEIKGNFVNVEDVLWRIKEKNENYFPVLFKRFLLLYASKFCKGPFVFGDSLGQVASQTMENLLYIGNGFPVFRPLIGLDKEDIMELSKKIGLYDLCAQKVDEPCTKYVPKHPELRAKKNYDDFLLSILEFAKNSEEITFKHGERE